MCARAFIPHAVSRMCLPPLRSPGVGPAASSPSRAPRSYHHAACTRDLVKAAGVGLWGRVERTARSHFVLAMLRWCNTALQAKNTPDIQM